jgi:hypothetical protein
VGYGDRHINHRNRPTTSNLHLIKSPGFDINLTADHDHHSRFPRIRRYTRYDNQRHLHHAVAELWSSVLKGMTTLWTRLCT